jgi:hypothetical protein
VLLAVTVVAGFSSSIFLPLTGLLVDRYGWRTTLLALAVLHGAVTVPLHALVLRRPPAHAKRVASSHAATTGRNRPSAPPSATHGSGSSRSRSSPKPPRSPRSPCTWSPT